MSRRAPILAVILIATADPVAAQDDVPIAVQEEAARVLLFQKAMAEGRVFSRDGDRAAPDGLVALPLYAPADTSRTHTVIKGDTLFSLARRFTVGLDDLLKENGLTNNRLEVGQTLRIPEPLTPKAALTHTVEAGQTLWSISQLHCTKVDLLVAANPAIVPGGLRPGQTLDLPAEGCVKSSG